MPEAAQLKDPEFKAAFLKNEQQERISTGKVASALVVVLMPPGVALDYAMYPTYTVPFLIARFIVSFLVSGIFLLHFTKFGRENYKVLGLPIALLPAGSIAWMIYALHKPDSPYYAGLNLILLAVSVVVHWSTLESLLAVVGVLIMYFAACVPHGIGEHSKDIFNNLYFLALTGIIVVTGNYFFNQLRFREFTLRYELDKSRALLAESNEKLKELDQIKNRFFANISHELRTPLTLLLSPLESMLHSGSQQFNEQTRNLLSIMHGNGMRLLKLINDLLDLVRLESGRMEVKREPVEMLAFVRGLMGAAQQMADIKGLKLVNQVQPELGAVLLDRDKLEKTVLNLVFNALKFTPAGGSVTMRVFRQAEQVVLTVEDTGVGISAKNLPFVFDRFWQADNSSKRKYQGVGIGLSLVKELTEIQGGNVSVTSQEGKGTTFTVILPYMRAEGAAMAAKPDPALPAPAPVSTSSIPSDATAPIVARSADAPAPAVQSEEWLSNLYRRAELFPITATAPEKPQSRAIASNATQPTLLVADDEPDMLRFLKSQLYGHYNVVEAVDGQQAVDKALATVPDVILLDMNMPEKDGLQVCRELRQHPSTQLIPIVILTARADEETKLTALSAGANDFLSKPFSTSELHVRVRNLVESHQNRMNLARQKQVLEKTIEQLKETETLLVQTEKMASLGRMSAGILHEINNPLNYATTGLYTLQKKRQHVAPEQQAEYGEVLDEINEGIARVRSIVSDLKSFTHPDTEMRDAVEVQLVAGSALRFLSSEWKDKVLIEQDLPEHLLVHGNRNKLLQVFVNLLQNSLDAVRRKSFADDEQPKIRISGRNEGGKAYVTVRDNGEGIEANALDKVFDPFFTTKDVGEGMGLGLTICYRIVQEYQGRISVHSERGKYSEFRLEFPSVAADAAMAQTAA